MEGRIKLLNIFGKSHPGLATRKMNMEITINYQDQ